MPDESNLLLQNILLEQRATRMEVSELSKTMISKENLSDYRAEMKTIFDEMKKTVKEQSNDFAEMKIEHDKNTSFRKGIINSTKYVAGAIFVAALGVASAIIPTFFPHPSNSTPQVVSTPFKAMHLNVPHM